MVAGHQNFSIWKHVFGAVGKQEFGLALHNPSPYQISQVCVEPDSAEGHHYFYLFQAGKLAIEEWSAVGQFLGKRLVGWWCTTTGRSDVGVQQLQTVINPPAIRLIGKPCPVENWIHEVAGRVSGEWPTGTVGAMRSRRQAKDQYACIVISEARNRLAPVLPVAVGAALLPRN